MTEEIEITETTEKKPVIDKDLIAMGVGFLTVIACVTGYALYRKYKDKKDAEKRLETIKSEREEKLDLIKHNQKLKEEGLEIPPKAEVKEFTKEQVAEAEATKEQITFSQKFLIPVEPETIDNFGFQQIAAMKVCDKEDGSEDRVIIDCNAQPVIINIKNNEAEGFEVFDNLNDCSKRLAVLNKGYADLRNTPERIPKSRDEAIERMMEIIRDTRDKG